MNDAQKNFCRNLRILRGRYGFNEWQMARVLKLSYEAMEALTRGEWSEEVAEGSCC